jgi:hypothetical protein
MIPRGTVLGLAHWLDWGRWETTPLGEYHNHSTCPTAINVRRGWQRFLVANRNVMPGEEITVDYRKQPDLEQPKIGWR